MSVLLVNVFATLRVVLDTKQKVEPNCTLQMYSSATLECSELFDTLNLVL